MNKNITQKTNILVLVTMIISVFTIYIHSINDEVYSTSSYEGRELIRVILDDDDASKEEKVDFRNLLILALNLLEGNSDSDDSMVDFVIAMAENMEPQFKNLSLDTKDSIRGFLLVYESTSNDEVKETIKEIISDLKINSRVRNLTNNRVSGFGNISKDINNIILKNSSDNRGTMIFVTMLEFISKEINSHAINFDGKHIIINKNFNSNLALKDSLDMYTEVSYQRGTSIEDLLREIEVSINKRSKTEIRNFKDFIKDYNSQIVIETISNDDDFHENIPDDPILKEDDDVIPGGAIGDEINILQIIKDDLYNELGKEDSDLQEVLEIITAAKLVVDDSIDENEILKQKLDEMVKSTINKYSIVKPLKENGDFVLNKEIVSKTVEALEGIAKIVDKEIRVVLTIDFNEYIQYIDEVDNKNLLVAYQVDTMGNLRAVKNSRYNEQKNIMTVENTKEDKIYIKKAEVNLSDIESVLWAKNQIEFLAARDIVKGLPNGRYNPHGNITRAELITLIVNTFDLASPNAKVNFTDIKEDDWYSNQIAIASDLGIVSGYPNGEFRPNAPISRADMSAIIKRTFNIINKDLIDNIKDKNSNNFADENDIPQYAKESVLIISELGIINGYPGNLFMPLQSLTRAEAAVVIHNLLDM